MKRAQQLADSLLEAGPDDVDAHGFLNAMDWGNQLEAMGYRAVPNTLNRKETFYRKYIEPDYAPGNKISFLLRFVPADELGRREPSVMVSVTQVWPNGATDILTATAFDPLETGERMKQMEEIVRIASSVRNISNMMAVAGFI